MDPIFETDFSPETSAVTVAGAEVQVLDPLEGRCLVSCAHEVGVAQQWRRRWDLEEARRTRSETLGDELQEPMRQADADGDESTRTGGSRKKK